MSSHLRRWASLGPILVALAALPGCPPPPAMHLHHAEVRGVSPMGLNVLVYLPVYDDHGYDVQVRAVRAHVTVGRGYAAAPINWAPNVWLPAKQTTVVAVPTTIPWQLIPTLIAETGG